MRIFLVLILLLLPMAAQAATTRTAIFAGGNFWSLQAALNKVPGIDHTVAGYTGGILANPSYLQVGKGNTGHRLAVLVVYDPAKVTYEQLLQVFWRNIDPRDTKGQFCERGPQFTAAIYYADEAQRMAAEDSKSLIEADSGEPVTTIITRAGVFYPAEEYHQNYYQKNPLRFRFYSSRCGRDQGLYDIWGKSSP